jgi:hypothetical protein
VQFTQSLVHDQGSFLIQPLQPAFKRVASLAPALISFCAFNCNDCDNLHPRRSTPTALVAVTEDISRKPERIAVQTFAAVSDNRH